MSHKQPWQVSVLMMNVRDADRASHSRRFFNRFRARAPREMVSAALLLNRAQRIREPEIVQECVDKAFKLIVAVSP